MRLSILWDIPVAAALLTRLPLPRLPKRAFEHTARASWAYPLIGLLLGALAACVWYIAAYFALPPVVCAILSLCAMALMTGAMHEDGLADTADGLWGGQTKERRLEIMRDSRIGTYGVLALVFSVALRIAAAALTGPTALVLAAVISRAPLPIIMGFMPHARQDGLSHGVGQPGYHSYLPALGLGALAGLTVPAAFLLAMLAAACAALIAYRKISGQTGDILGAVQQITEIAVLLTILASAGLASEGLPSAGPDLAAIADAG